MSPLFLNCLLKNNNKKSFFRKRGFLPIPKVSWCSQMPVFSQKILIRKRFFTYFGNVLGSILKSTFCSKTYCPKTVADKISHFKKIAMLCNNLKNKLHPKNIWKIKACQKFLQISKILYFQNLLRSYQKLLLSSIFQIIKIKKKWINFTFHIS